jgi:hypothetical protein
VAPKTIQFGTRKIPTLATELEFKSAHLLFFRQRLKKSSERLYIFRKTCDLVGI